MTDAELLLECKKGLGIPTASTAHDLVLTQKLLAVKSFIKGAGVSDTMLSDDLSTSVIVMGVTDIWNLEAGEIKFSPVFICLLGQLTATSLLLTVSCNPADGAANVAVDIKPVLTFNCRIRIYSVQMYVYDDTDQEVSIDHELDVTQRVLTVEPQSNLAVATKYAIVVTAVSHKGPQLERTVFSFTTI
jgi:hypothetical protein